MFPYQSPVLMRIYLYLILTHMHKHTSTKKAIKKRIIIHFYISSTLCFVSIELKSLNQILDL